MSFRSNRRVRSVLLPIVLAASAAGSLPATASAPHLDPACTSAGVTVTSYGATFQTIAQNAFIAAYNARCGAGSASITYNNPLGSGAGSGRCVTLVTTHTPPAGYGDTPYCGSDEALTSDQWAAANSNGGVVNQIPVAIGAVAISYNNPACPSPLVLSSEQTSELFAGTNRLGASVSTWAQITGAPCGASATPITRVVRNAGSGTTCIFKTYLAKRNPNPWAALNATTGCGSTSWPAAVTQANGNTGIAATVNATAGAVGYVELSAAKAAGNTVANVKTAAQDVTGGSENPDTGTRANCSDTGAHLPAHTSSPGWDQVSLSDGPTGYPICGYTYAFVFAKNSLAYGGRVTLAQTDAAVDLLLVANTTNPGRFYAPIGAHAAAEARVGLATIDH